MNIKGMEITGRNPSSRLISAVNTVIRLKDRMFAQQSAQRLKGLILLLDLIFCLFRNLIIIKRTKLQL